MWKSYIGHGQAKLCSLQFVREIGKWSYSSACTTAVLYIGKVTDSPDGFQGATLASHNNYTALLRVSIVVLVSCILAFTDGNGSCPFANTVGYNCTRALICSGKLRGARVAGNKGTT